MVLLSHRYNLDLPNQNNKQAAPFSLPFTGKLCNATPHSPQTVYAFSPHQWQFTPPFVEFGPKLFKCFDNCARFVHRRPDSKASLYSRVLSANVPPDATVVALSFPFFFANLASEFSLLFSLCFVDTLNCESPGYTLFVGL